MEFCHFMSSPVSVQFPLWTREVRPIQMWTEVRRFTSPFQRRGANYPSGLLTALHTHARTWTETCIYMELSLLSPFCSLLALWMRTVSWQCTFYLIYVVSLPPPFPLFLFSVIVILSAFVSGWLFLLPSSFLLSLSHPRTHPSLCLLSHLLPPFPVVLVCVLVCHEGGWRLIGGWWFGQTPDTGTASQCGNV